MSCAQERFGTYARRRVSRSFALSAALEAHSSFLLSVPHERLLTKFCTVVSRFSSFQGDNCLTHVDVHPTLVQDHCSPLSCTHGCGASTMVTNEEATAAIQEGHTRLSLNEGTNHGSTASGHQVEW